MPLDIEQHDGTATIASSGEKLSVTNGDNGLRIAVDVKRKGGRRRTRSATNPNSERESNVDMVDHDSRSNSYQSSQGKGEHSQAVLEIIDQRTRTLSKKETRSKTGILVLLVVVNWFNTMCYSIQAPFYPAAAERKGATATEYGLVFGVFELVALLSTPFYGKYMTTIGPKFMLNTGIFVTSCCSMLFGFLDMCPPSSFLILSFAVRIVEALGSSAFTTACFTLCSLEFPENRATAMAIVETAFGLGVITGPTVGGALFEVGGFILPFVTLGLVLFVSACITVCVLPSHETSDIPAENPLKILRHLPVAFSFFSVCSVTISTGFLTATLEPYLRQFGLSPFQTGLMFMLSGAMYAITSPLWGRLGDKYKAPYLICMFAALVAAVGYLFIGPNKFIPITPNLWLCVAALITQGIGVQGEAVLGYMAALQALYHYGYKDDALTHSMATSLWVGSFSFGAFIGPSLGGFMYDEVGFRLGTSVIVVLHIMVAMVCFYYYKHFQRLERAIPYKQLDLERSEKTALLASGAYHH